MKQIDTIIIGAGMAGLGCGHQFLKKNKKDFLIISEDIGGRVCPSADGRVNYGAYFVLENYHHIVPYVTKRERFHPFLVDMHGGRKAYHLIRIFEHPLQVVRLMFILFHFKKLYTSFKKRCETQSQRQAFESDPELMRLYLLRASDYARQEGIQNIAQKFISEGVYLCTFLPLAKVSAFDFLRFSLALIMRAHEFFFEKDLAIEGMQKNILEDSVGSIKKKKDRWIISTKGGISFSAQHVIVATPPHISKKLLGVEKIKNGANAFVFHVKGKLRNKWSAGQFEVFNARSKTIFIRRQEDGTFIFYSRDPKPKFEIYFEEWETIFTKQWKPAFSIDGDTLLECERDKNLYLIGDHNVIGMEDSYITGIYAANRILSNC